MSFLRDSEIFLSLTQDWKSLRLRSGQALGYFRLSLRDSVPRVSASSVSSVLVRC